MTKMRTYKVAVILLFMMMVVGCASLSDLMRRQKFDDTVDNFRQVMRWSTLEAAMGFRKGEQAVDPSELNMLKRIKITSCEMTRTTPLENKTQIRQVAEIQYYKIDDPLVRNLSANLLWEYDPIQDNWYIIDGWPEFK